MQIIVSKEVLFSKQYVFGLLIGCLFYTFLAEILAPSLGLTSNAIVFSLFFTVRLRCITIYALSRQRTPAYFFTSVSQAIRVRRYAPFFLIALWPRPQSKQNSFLTLRFLSERSPVLRTVFIIPLCRLRCVTLF